jgi:hypothetical protein
MAQRGRSNPPQHSSAGRGEADVQRTCSFCPRLTQSGNGRFEWQEVLIPRGSFRALRAAGWVANAARSPVPYGRTSLQQADSVVQGHALN